MSRARANHLPGERGFPRVSGDEPVTQLAPGELSKFSPRERG